MFEKIDEMTYRGKYSQETLQILNELKIHAFNSIHEERLQVLSDYEDGKKEAAEGKVVSGAMHYFIKYQH